MIEPLSSADTLQITSDRLARLVSLAVSEVPGVARFGRVPSSSLLSATTHSGIAIRLGDEGALVDCYLIGLSAMNLLEVGIAVQATVAAVCQTIAGIRAQEVNVCIQDVEVRRG